MSTAALRTPRNPPQPSPQDWFLLTGPAATWSGNNQNCVEHSGIVYLAFCDGGGNARVLSYTKTTGAVVISPAIVTGLNSDAHCSPSIIVRSSDSKLLLAVCRHNLDASMYVAVSTNADDVTSWGAATDISSTLGSVSVTYANLFQLSAESGKVYLFYRDQVTASNYRLCYSTSTDGGATWTAATILYGNGSTQSYWAISSDYNSRIDFVASNGSATNGVTASVYHFYYSGGFKKSDGTAIASSGLTPSDLTKIYDGATNGSCRAPYDIQTNGGSPVAVWAAYNSAGSGSNENYWYGTCSGGIWTVNTVTDSGSTPDANFAEGGIVIDSESTSSLYVSKETSSVWQMFVYTTANGGSSWTSTQLSSDAPGVPTDGINMRPRSPLNATGWLKAVWGFGPHYSIGAAQEPAAAQVRGYPNPIQVF